MKWEKFGGDFVDDFSIQARGDMSIDMVGLNTSGSYDFKTWSKL